MKRLSAMFTKSRVLFFAAALCLALPFNVPALFCLSFVGAALLFCAAHTFSKKAGLRRHFAAGFGFGFFYHLCIYHWLMSLHPLAAANLSGVVSLLIVLLAYVGASAIHAAFFGVGFWLWGALRKRLDARLSLSLFGLCLLVSEALTGVGTLAFPWARFSLPLAECPPLLAVSALVGPMGAEALLLLFGALVAAAVFFARRRVLCAVLAALTPLSSLGFGLLWQSAAEGVTLKVAAVQTAYSYEEKWQTDTEEIRAACRSAALFAAREGVDLIVFPESVLATRVVRGDANEVFFAALSEECDAVIAAGCVYSEGGETYNALCLFDSSGLVSFGAKRHLVPFGEYLPYQDLLKILLPAVGNMSYYRSDYSVGESGLAGDALGTRFGCLVCFDTLFSSLCVESAREGANLLLAPTNDAWFKHSVASRQHLWHGTWRAVETGRGFVQAANVGITALVDCTGRVTESVPLGESGVVVGEISLSDVRTPYVQTGDLVVPVTLLLLGAAAHFALFRRRGGKQK